MEREEAACSAWFQKIDHIGDRTLYRLKEHFGSMKGAYEGQEGKLREVLSERQFTAFRAAWQGGEPLQYLAHMERKGIRYVPFGDEVYPEKLRNIPDPPFGLFVKGSLPDEGRASVAIIGARACSEYGKAVSKSFGAKLADYGVQVISGMARGIDSISQRACLEAGGHTFGILGCGVDICYPTELKDLYQDIQSHGGILSSYPPGMPPISGNFPPRNRIISGLADVVLVVEARRKSGTLITVDMALEQGKEVAVIPGRITDSLSQGCFDLVKQGATAVSEAEQLMELLEGIHKQQSFLDRLSKEKIRFSSENSHKKEERRIQCNSLSELDDRLKSIWEILEEEPASPEILFQRWNTFACRDNDSFRDFMEGLMDLELLDLCKSDKNRFSIR